MSVLLGAIADDFTGATDLCNTLVRRGMRTVQLIDVPAPGTAVADAEAVVVALKSRTIPAAEAIEKSLAALAWLRQAGARQILFKYCSTFDSTDAGNIGPVAEALMDGARHRLHPVLSGFSRKRADDLPRLSVRRRRAAVGIGHARPPADADARPEPRARSAASVPRQGRARTAIRCVARRGGHPRRLSRRCGRPVFATRSSMRSTTDNLEAIGEAAADFPLITGGSGIALGLPENFRRQGLLGDSAAADALPPVAGAAVVLSGSCSEATRAQVAYMRERAPLFTVDPIAAAAGRDDCRGGARLGDAAARRSAGPDQRDSAARGGRRDPGRRSAASAPARWSRRLSPRLPRGLAEKGARRFVIAGGETAGAIVQALGVTGLAHRPADRSRRAVDRSLPEPRRAGPGVGAQIRQFRRARLLPARLFRALRRGLAAGIFKQPWRLGRLASSSRGHQSAHVPIVK